jgi:hypothetical protein
MTKQTQAELEALSKEEIIERVLHDQQQRKRQQRRLLLVGVVTVLLVVGFFSWRAITRWRDRPTLEPIQSWMNIPHIARAYDVPPHLLAEALGLPPESPDRRPIQVIAEEQDRDVDLVIAILNDAIRKAKPAGWQPPRESNTPSGAITTTLPLSNPVP